MVILKIDRPATDSDSPGHSEHVSAALSHSAPLPLDFDALYEAHVDGVWRLAQRLGVPDSGLEDAVQEVFLIAHRRLADFRGESTLKTWLGGITVRVAKDVRRSASRKGTPEPLEDHPQLESPHRLEETVSQRQALAQVLKLLDALDDDLREVLVFADLEGLSAPEIAEITGTNLNTIYTRLRTARQRFNALVAEKGVGR